MPTELTATCYFRVARRVRFPFQAEVGDVVAIMPPPCPQNVWVHEPDTLWVIRRTHFEEGKLWTELADLMEDGTLLFIHSPSFGLLSHLLSAGELSPPQALRLLRPA